MPDNVMTGVERLQVAVDYNKSALLYQAQVTTAEQLERLQELYQNLEDDIEGENLPPLQRTPLL